MKPSLKFLQMISIRLLATYPDILTKYSSKLKILPTNIWPTSRLCYRSFKPLDNISLFVTNCLPIQFQYDFVCNCHVHDMYKLE